MSLLESERHSLNQLFKMSHKPLHTLKVLYHFLITPIISLVLGYCVSSLEESLHLKTRGFVLWTPHQPVSRLALPSKNSMQDTQVI